MTITAKALSSPLFDALPESIGMFDLDGTIIAANRRAVEVLGYDNAEELIGVHYRTLTAPEAADQARSLFERTLADGQIRGAHLPVRRRDGRRIPAEISASLLRDDNGDPTAVIGMMRDISEQKRIEEQLTHRALHDDLTSLPNRVLLNERIGEALDAAQQTGEQVALLLLDLDRFKEINDTFGHEWGDLLLQMVGARIWNVLGEKDAMVARLGGDEFAILLPDTNINEATLLAVHIIRALEEAFVIQGHNLGVETSVGIALHPQHGHTASALLRRADVAMYAAKSHKRGYAIYAPEQDHYNPDRLELVGDLRHALSAYEVLLYYQPKVHIKSRRVIGVEALARWRHPRLGLIGPEQFVSLAEHTGLIRAFSTYVLGEAIQQCRAWLDAGLDPKVAVNLSARNLPDPNLLLIVEGLLAQHNVDPRRLVLEVTESAVMVEQSQIRDHLSRLHDMGITISIDDFGTGHSSLAYLSQLPVDELKIDRAFVTDMTTNHHHSFIVRSVADLGHNLGLTVVAEGIEDELTMGLLGALGCDAAQGFHICPPVPAAELELWLRERVLSV